MAHILLLEPDKVLAETYASYLKSLGHQVVICRGAQEGISAADRKVPDIIVIELQLIDHSGIEFLYELRSYNDWQTIPVIIQSLVPPAEFNRNWQLLKDQLGVRGYLYKPMATLMDLSGAINQHLVLT